MKNKIWIFIIIIIIFIYIVVVYLSNNKIENKKSEISIENNNNNNIKKEYKNLNKKGVEDNKEKCNSPSFLKCSQKGEKCRILSQSDDKGDNCKKGLKCDASSSDNKSFGICVKMNKNILSLENKIKKLFEGFKNKKKYLVELPWTLEKIKIKNNVVRIYLNEKEEYYNSDQGFFWFRDILNKEVFADKKISRLEVFNNGNKFDLCALQDMMGGCIPEYWVNNRSNFNKKLKLKSPENKTVILKIPKLKFSKQDNKFIINFENFEVPYTKAVLNASLRKLFQLRGGDPNEFWDGLQFDKVKIINNQAIIELSGQWYPDGDMSQFYFKREIEATVFQFKNIKSLKVLVNGKIFDWCVDDESEGEGGCNLKPMLWIKNKKQ